MASLVVRNLDDRVKNALAEQAARNGRSMEAEVREILAKSVKPRNPLRRLHEIALANEATGELELPE